MYLLALCLVVGVPERALIDVTTEPYLKGSDSVCVKVEGVYWDLRYEDDLEVLVSREAARFNLTSEKKVKIRVIGERFRDVIHVELLYVILPDGVTVQSTDLELVKKLKKFTQRE